VSAAGRVRVAAEQILETWTDAGPLRLRPVSRFSSSAGVASVVPRPAALEGKELNASMVLDDDEREIVCLLGCGAPIP
jgi:hypothetical protein